MSSGDGATRAKKPLSQPPLTVWPLGACVGALLQRNRRGVLFPCASDADCRPCGIGSRQAARSLHFEMCTACFRVHIDIISLYSGTFALVSFLYVLLSRVL